jgi:predicted transcriptional regulator
MSKTARDVPPPLELLCLKALWPLGEGNVKDVQQAVAQTRPLAYTTIMTVLERLARKGKLTRRKRGRAFLYAPTMSEDAMRRVAVRELVESFFGGSAEDLVRFLGAPEMAAVAPAENETPAAKENARIDTVLL